jgi:hypothetical protein
MTHHLMKYLAYNIEYFIKTTDALPEDLKSAKYLVIIAIVHDH